MTIVYNTEDPPAEADCVSPKLPQESVDSCFENILLSSKTDKDKPAAVPMMFFSKPVVPNLPEPRLNPVPRNYPPQPTNIIFYFVLAAVAVELLGVAVPAGVMMYRGDNYCPVIITLIFCALSNTFCVKPKLHHGDTGGRTSRIAWVKYISLAITTAWMVLDRAGENRYAVKASASLLMLLIYSYPIFTKSGWAMLLSVFSFSTFVVYTISIVILTTVRINYVLLFVGIMLPIAFVGTPFIGLLIDYMGARKKFCDAFYLVVEIAIVGSILTMIFSN